MGGLKEGFTADHSCRHCMADRSKIRKMTRENPDLLRTVKDYEIQMKNLEGAKTSMKRTELSRNYGINNNSILNTLMFFHIVVGLVPDIFHDILEGCLLRTLQLLLKRFLQGRNQVMSLDEFNRRLVEFDYGFSETKPSIILPDHLISGAKIHQTGMQIWNLAIIVPFILGPHIDSEDKYWRNYLLLLEITSLAFAHEISITMIGYWQNIIDEYLSTFQTLYETHLISKQHFLIHYPSLTLRFGPLYLYCTLRPEAKHQVFKDFIRKTKSYKNPSVSMAMQHQLYQTYILGGPISQVGDQGPIKQEASADFPFENIIPDSITTFASVPWIEIDGIKYQSQKCFIMTNYINSMPCFILLFKIIYVENNPVFICKQAKTVEHYLHFNAYEIVLQETFQLLTQKELYVHAVYHSHEVNGKYYISVKRSVGDIH